MLIRWACLISLFSLLLTEISTAQVNEHILVDGIQRDYILHLPKGLPKGAPLVLAFHGYTGDAKGMMEEFGINAVADEKGFAVCYPEGLKDQKGNGFWQVGYSFHQNLKVDDIKFITTLADALQVRFGLSRENTFITGISNGGDLCNMLICRTTGKFKAAAPLLGCIMKDIYDSCRNSKPVPVFMLNGMKDDITYWDGDMQDHQGYGPYLPTKWMLDFRIAQTGCGSPRTDTLVGNPRVEDDYIIRQKFQNTLTGNQVWMYTVKNGRHEIPDYVNFANEVWDFFLQYVK
jgi:polyhydroxybutyrate depolymerase